MIDDATLENLRQTCAAPLPHPDAATLRGYRDLVADWLLSYHASLPEQPIGQTASRADMEALLREPLPEEGQEFATVLAEFQQKVAPYAFRVNHPRFLAFVPSAPNLISVLGDWLCAGTNFFAGVWLEAAGPAQVELLVLDWFKELLGYPQEARGILTGGGSEANLTALVVARDRLSFGDRSRAVLYQPENRHWSIDRAARIIGLAPHQVRSLPTDPSYRFSPSALEAAVLQDRYAGRLPWLVVANGGATNTGTVDPVSQLADVCARQLLWLHVDAAYGWPLVLTDEGEELRDGLARADSIALDPHKWFAQPFEAGCLLVREGRLLPETFALRPEYMQDVFPAEDEINFADHGIALTRRFRALKIWFSIKVLGLGWFRKLVSHCCRLAELAQGLLERIAEFEILNPRQLSIVCFRYVPARLRREAANRERELNQFNLLLAERLRATQRAFVSTTLLQGRVALRVCFVNWRTRAADVETIVHLLTDLGKELAT